MLNGTWKLLFVIEKKRTQIPDLDPLIKEPQWRTEFRYAASTFDTDEGPQI